MASAFDSAHPDPQLQPEILALGAAAARTSAAQASVAQASLAQAFTAQATSPSFSSVDFRAALAMFATGVTIVTARTPAGDLVGLTANSFNSVSIQPPLVLWSLSRTATSMEAFSTGSHYAVHILAASQKALAQQFASKSADRWQGVDYALSSSGVPLLSGCVARFECFNRSRYEEGDHVIFVGEVEHCTAQPTDAPLLFHGGKFYTEQLL